MRAPPLPKFSARKWAIPVLVVVALWQACTIRELESKVEDANAMAIDAYNEARKAKQEAESAKSEVKELRTDLAYD